MNSESKAWENLKAEYLNKVKKALSSVKHPHMTEVLEDVQSHLDQRFAALEPDEQTRKNLEGIISEMGPAAEYAELLTSNAVPSARKVRPKYLLYLSIIGIVAIIGIVLAIAILPKADSSNASQPVVIETRPGAFANDVSSDIKEITVTFDQPMMNLSWSWVGSGETFPKVTGQPRYDKNKTTCALPVELEAGKFYWIGINSPQFKNFQTEMGTPAVPYVILFATKDEDGNPTAIPENYLEEAREINSSKLDLLPKTRWNCLPLLDFSTRTALGHFEMFYEENFHKATGYDVASQKQKDAMVEQWIREIHGLDYEKAVLATAAIGDAKAHNAITVLTEVATTKGGDNRIKWIAVRGLAKMVDRETVPVLIQLIDHYNKNVCTYAKVALAEITGQFFGDSKEQWQKWWEENKQKNEKSTNGQEQGKR